MDRKTDRWTLAELARRIWEERSRIVLIGNEKQVPYYMLNIRQPGIGELYRQWGVERRAINYPPGDLERLEWELGLFNQEALDRLQRHFEAVDEAVDEMERKLRKEKAND